jgi:type IV secretory pathway TrbL component
MSFLNRKTCWNNKELGVFKICVASFYVVIGAWFHEFFLEYKWIFIALFVITMIWTFSLWLRKLKSEA